MANYPLGIICIKSTSKCERLILKRWYDIFHYNLHGIVRDHHVRVRLCWCEAVSLQFKGSFDAINTALRNSWPCYLIGYWYRYVLSFQLNKAKILWTDKYLYFLHFSKRVSLPSSLLGFENLATFIIWHTLESMVLQLVRFCLILNAKEIHEIPIYIPENYIWYSLFPWENYSM